MGRPRKRPIQLSDEEVYRALDPDSREQQMINLAVNLAEQKLRDGTATSPIICHYLELGSLRGRTRQQMLEKKIELMDAQTEAIKSEKHVEELFANAITAMKSYTGLAEIGGVGFGDNQDIQ